MAFAMVLTPAVLSAAPVAATSCVCADAPDACSMAMAVSGGCERCCLATLPVAAETHALERVDLQPYAPREREFARWMTDPIVPPPRQPRQSHETIT